MSAEDLCAECYMPVRPRQEGLQCDGCFTWQHRTCKTGISQHEYREAVKSGQDIDWRCKYCTYTSERGTEDEPSFSGNEVSLTMPVAMSTRINEASVTGWLSTTYFNSKLTRSNFLRLLIFLRSVKTLKDRKYTIGK